MAKEFDLFSLSKLKKITKGKGETSSTASDESSSQTDSNSAVSTLTSHANHLLLSALLDYVCSLHVQNKRKSEKLFIALTSQLVQLNILPSHIIVEEFSAIRTQYKHNFAQLLHVSVTSLNEDAQLALPPVNSGLRDEKAFANSLRIPQPTASQFIGFHTSRYRDEFVEMDPLGKGAYGSVHKARHKLDGKVYAVKKVVFQENTPELWHKTLREVKHLADLNHTTVIRYYTAWLEYHLPTIKYQESLKTQDDFEVPALTYINNFEDDLSILKDRSGSPDSNNNPEEADLSGGSSIVFEDPAPVSPPPPPPSDRPRRRYNRTNSWERSGPDGTRSDWHNPAADDSHSTADEWTNLSYEHIVHGGDNNASTTRNSVILKSYVALHIQMELCTQTLQDWLRQRNNALPAGQDVFPLVEEDTNLLILRRVLQGVDYIHTQQLIHRDLKPSNIFLNSMADDSLEVKIGDFGLARLHSSPDRGSATAADVPLTPMPGVNPGRILDLNELLLTTGVGTTVYASPEQLMGANYGQKSDMYSLGLIMFEMFQPFGTGMERSKTLGELRKGRVCEEFRRRWPVLSEVILQMVDADPDNRPTAKDVLAGRLFHTDKEVIEMLRDSLQRRDDLIREQTRDLEARDREIQRLKDALAKRDSELETLRRLLNPLADS